MKRNLYARPDVSITPVDFRKRARIEVGDDELTPSMLRKKVEQKKIDDVMFWKKDEIKQAIYEAANYGNLKVILDLRENASEELLFQHPHVQWLQGKGFFVKYYPSVETTCMGEDTGTIPPAMCISWDENAENQNDAGSLINEDSEVSPGGPKPKSKASMKKEQGI